jgi:hypothetical protein
MMEIYRQIKRKKKVVKKKRKVSMQEILKQ